MLISGMFSKGFSFLLHHFSWHVTNVAFVCLIIMKTFILLSESSKSIKHNTLNDIAKQHSKESSINHIISESAKFKGFHSLRNGTWDIQRHDTIQHIITHFINTLSFCVNIFHVVAESYRTEDKDKNDSHETDIKQTLDIYSNSFENVSKNLNFAEDIN